MSGGPRVPLWVASLAGVGFFTLGFVAGVANQYEDASFVTRMNIYKVEQDQAVSLQEIVRILRESEERHR